MSPASQMRRVTSIVKTTVVKISMKFSMPPIFSLMPSKVERKISMVLITISEMITASTALSTLVFLSSSSAAARAFLNCWNLLIMVMF